jgi:recombination protein RecR
MEFSSKTINKAVEELSKFPGVGKKSAMRMVLHLVKKDKESTEALAEAISALKTDLKFCQRCGNVADHDLCEICLSVNRNKQMLCVVREFQDVNTIEQTGQYHGVYHVLGGLISPLDGIGPDDLDLEKLFARVVEEGIQEIILGLSATMEGDTTSFYISKKLADSGVNITVMSRGISVGGELEYADRMTLGRSIQNRVPFKWENQ